MIFQRAVRDQVQTGCGYLPFSTPQKKLETSETVYYLKRLFGVLFCVIITKGLLGRVNTNVQHDVISQNACFTCTCKIKHN
jgi:hypothetical protein